MKVVTGTNWKALREFFGIFRIETGTPQGSIISPLLFSLMINDFYADIAKQMGVSLFVDDGGIWKRGRNVDFIVQKMQGL